MNIKQINNKLRELGFAQYHSKILLYLLSENTYVDAQEIEEGSGVPLQRIYSILKDLEEENLIKKISGTVNQYAALPKEEFIENLINKNKKELQKQKKEYEQNALDLKNVLNLIPSQLNQEFNISYFNDDKNYWPVYIKAAKKLKKKDKYRIINSRRLANSILDFELKNNPDLKEMIEIDKKIITKGIKIHHITSPKALVKHLISELKNEGLVKSSINQLIKSYNNPKTKKNKLITIAPQFQNLILVILGNNVFIEFYNEKTNHIASAIHINSKNIAQDLANWFDSMTKNNTSTHEEFESELKKWYRKLRKK